LITMMREWHLSSWMKMKEPEGFFDDLGDAVEGCPTDSIKVETSPFKALVD
jgi:hypothetical protein